MAKYDRLCEYLRTLQESEWLASFTDIEDVLGVGLPASAKSYAAWWSNSGHHHARAWTDAGFKTCELNISRRTIVFRRVAADRSHEPKVRRATKAARAAIAPDAVAGLPVAHGVTMPLLGHDFTWFAEVKPCAWPDGRPREFMPQNDYARANEKPLNKHGRGPFCRFSIPCLPECPGLYAVTVDRRLAYVGIGKESLRQRWGPRGYAAIHPVNCYRGGQSTNCKINHAILLAVRDGQVVELWIRRESNPRPLEAHLIRELDPPWNDQS